MKDNGNGHQKPSDVAGSEQTIRELIRHLLTDSEEEMRQHIDALGPSEAAYVVGELYARVGQKRPDALERLRRWLRIFAACEASEVRRRSDSPSAYLRRKPPP